MNTLTVALLPETYASTKTNTELIDDITKTLNPDGLLVNSDSIPELWTYYLEMNVEPAGWQALWKPSRETSAETLNIFTGPTVVEVISVDYSSHEAVIESLEDDDSQGKQATVSLLDLHALRDQENSAIVIEKTHLALQKLRFFYEHLWFPWDLDDLTTDWVSTQLETRVNLYCEIRSGLLPKEITSRYHNLVSEAFRIHKELSAVEQQIEKQSEKSNQEAEPSETFRVSLLNEQLENVQKDIELIYNPDTRMALFAVNSVKERSKENPEVLIVINGQTIDQLQTFFKELGTLAKHEPIRSYPCLQDALNDACVNDTIVLPPGLHSLVHMRNLEFGGSITGIGDRNDIILQTSHAGDIAISIDCLQQSAALLKNLTVTVDARKSGIFVKSGRLNLDNCVIRGPALSPVDQQQTSPNQNASVAWKGLMIGPDTKVCLKNCVIQNFDVGLRIRQSSRVDVIDTVVETCNIGILTEKEAKLKFVSSTIRTCNESGIVVEVEENEQVAVGPLDNSVKSLAKIPNFDVTEESLRCERNGQDVQWEFVPVEEETSEEDSEQ